MKKLLSILCLLTACSVLGANWYVRPGGTGARTGVDWNNAWDSAGTLVSNVNAGDTVWLAGGVYANRIVSSRSGTSGSPISVKRVQSTDSVPTSAAGWNVTFDSQVIIGPIQSAWTHTTSAFYLGSNLVLDGRVTAGIHLLNTNISFVGYAGAVSFPFGAGGQSNITFMNIDIDGGFTPANNSPLGNVEAIAFQHQVSDVAQGSGILFSNCWIHSGNDNIYMQNCPNGLTLDHCKIYDNNYSSASFHANLIELQSVTNIVCRFCDFSNWAIEGFEIYGNCGSILIYSCVIHDCPSSVSTFLWPANTFNTTGSQGPVNVYGCTFARMNAIMSNQSKTMAYAAGSSATNNIYWQSPWFVPFQIPVMDYNFSDIAATGGHSISSGSNPFVNFGGSNYHILGTISATLPRNKGTPLQAVAGQTVNIDFDGNTRGADGSWDIGAYEFVSSAPVITVQPQSQTVLVGANATFSVVASGTAPLTYQWSLNGANIVGATTSSYTTNAVVIGANGISYTVGVTNSFGGVLSSAAVLTVNQPTGSLTNVYVAPNGLVSNTGATTNSPWPFDYAMANVGASNTIFLMNGNYTNTALGIQFPWTTIKALQKWGPQFRNLPSDGTGGVIRGLANGLADGTTIDGLSFSNCQYYPILFRAVGLSNCTVQNCWVTDTGKTWPASQSASAIQAYPCFNFSFINNLLERNGTNNSPFNHGLYVAGTNITMRGNVVRYNGGPGIQIYNGGNVPCTGIACFNNLVYSNNTTFTGGSEIIYEDDSSNDSFAVNDFFNNVVINQAQRYPIEIASIGTARLTNNIILYNTGGGAGGILTAYTPTIQRDYNLSTSALALTGPHDVTSGTENFVNRGQGLYWLTSGSPARSAALGLSMVPWFGGSAAAVTDIGAVQYAAGLTTDARVLDPSPSGGADYWTNVTSGGVAPTITTQPVATNLQVSQSFTLSVAVSGTPPFNYQWLRGSTVVQNGTTQSFTKPNAQTNDTGNYSVIVTNVFGTVTSSSVTVNVTNPAVPLMAINQSSLNYGITYIGNSVPLSFNVVNSGSGTLSGNVVATPPFTGNTNFVLSAGQSQACTVFYSPAAPELDTGTITITNTSLGGTTNVSATGIGILLQNPTNLVMSDATVLYGFVNSTTGSIYQPFAARSPLQTNVGVAYLGFSLPNQWTNAYLQGWMEATNAINGFWVAIDAMPLNPGNTWIVSNALPAGLNLFPVTWLGPTNQVPQDYTNSWNLAAGAHYVQVMGFTANTVLGNMFLTQQTPTFPIPPIINVQPVAQTILAGTPVTFSVSATGTLPLAYQWNFNGSPISGANQTAYTIVYPLPTDNGQYSCTVTNVAGATPSFPATLVVTNGSLSHVKIHIH